MLRDVKQRLGIETRYWG